VLSRGSVPIVWQRWLILLNVINCIRIRFHGWHLCDRSHVPHDTATTSGPWGPPKIGAELIG
jgi:hypothetical protein